MALALRFDLYLHYLRLPNHAQNRKGEHSKRSPYMDATGKWGERFWTWGAKKDQLTAADGARFKKIYFKASLIGYVIGLITTLVVLNIFQHGQPALFYLVPAVLGSLWGTSLVRGDLKLMWEYTEDGSLNQDDDKKHKKKVLENGRSELSGARDSAKTPTEGGKDEHAQHVFLFSLTAPKQGGPKKALIFDKT